MKTARIVFACALIMVFVTAVSAQKTETTKEGDIKTTEPSDKYGAGGTHVTISDKKYKLRHEYYYDKNGIKREEVYPGEPADNFPPENTYFDEKGKFVVMVKHTEKGDVYYDGRGVRMDPTHGKEIVAKMEQAAASNAPEKPGGQVKARPQAPPSIVPPSGTSPFLGPPFSPATSTWSGFYIGVEGNYTRSSADFSLMPTGDFNRFPDLSDELSFRGRHEFDGDGGGIGGYGGYNWMLCEHFLFGLEIEGRRVWGLKDHFKTGDFDFGRLGMFDIHSSFDTEEIPYVVTFGPRLGYILDRFLPYLRGGLAFGQVDAHQGILTSALGGNTNGKESASQVGWCVGGGLEYALTDHWRLRVEYQYTDLGTPDFSGWGHPDQFRNFTSWNSVHVTEHSGNFGVGYAFGSFSRP
jgi:outer membrane immunogenic protein